jgi:histidine triad (HIT) family protein
MADCLFCKIAAGEAAADVIQESDKIIAFRDINPQAPTHVLVIPKRHIGSVLELGSDRGAVLDAIFETLAQIATDEGLERGFRIVTNTGPQAGQSVPHLHFHLLGGRSLSWPPG